MSEIKNQRPEIDYLAKDFASFRHLLIDYLSVLAPDWQETNPADLGHTLVDTLAYAADYLSYYQDAVATEAYLGTARVRRSVKRHTRLLDYHLGEGANARVWVHVSVAGSAVEGVLLPKGTRFLTAGATPLTKSAIRLAELRNHLFQHPAAARFESMHDAQLYPDLNQIAFMTSGTVRDRTLKRGATFARLKAADPHNSHLAVGDILLLEQVLDPVSGSDVGVDPHRRHVVRLTEVQPITTPEPGLYVRWGAEDALPFDLYIAPFEGSGGAAADARLVSVARGNIILADHGITYVETLRRVRHSERFRPVLSRTRLTFAAPYDHFAARQLSARQTVVQKPRAVAAAIKVWERVDHTPIRDEGPVGATILGVEAAERAAASTERTAPGNEPTNGDAVRRREWLLQRELLNSDSFDRNFVIETHGDGRVNLRFGFLGMGRLPVPGTQFEAQYRIGTGTSGNIGLDAIGLVVLENQLSPSDILSVFNPLAASGGRDPELLSEARLHAPFAQKETARCVTAADYAEVAERHPRVTQAVAELHWTGTWYAAVLYVRRAGADLIDAPFRDEIHMFMEPFLMTGYELEVRPARYVPVAITLTVQVSDYVHQLTVQKMLGERLSAGVQADGKPGFFHADRLGFGDTIHRSELVAAAMAVPGVVDCVVERFGRLGETRTREMIPMQHQEVIDFSKSVLLLQLEGGL